MDTTRVNRINFHATPKRTTKTVAWFGLRIVMPSRKTKLPNATLRSLGLSFCIVMFGGRQAVRDIGDGRDDPTVWLAPVAVRRRTMRTAEVRSSSSSSPLLRSDPSSLLSTGSSSDDADSSPFNTARLCSRSLKNERINKRIRFEGREIIRITYAVRTLWSMRL